MKYLLLFLFYIPICSNAQHPSSDQTRKLSVYGVPSKNDTLVVVTADVLRSRSSHAGYCYFSVENTTGYFIDIWIEDFYLGRISPFSGALKFDVSRPSDWTKWHARTIGGKIMWDGISYCNNNRTFQLKLK